MTIASLFLHASSATMERSPADGAGHRKARCATSPCRISPGHLARRGDVTGAMKLASKPLKRPKERLTAIQLIACAVRDGETIKMKID